MTKDGKGLVEHAAESPLSKAQDPHFQSCWIFSNNDKSDVTGPQVKSGMGLVSSTHRP